MLLPVCDSLWKSQCPASSRSSHCGSLVAKLSLSARCNKWNPKCCLLSPAHTEHDAKWFHTAMDPDPFKRKSITTAFCAVTHKKKKNELQVLSSIQFSVLVSYRPWRKRRSRNFQIAAAVGRHSQRVIEWLAASK